MNEAVHFIARYGYWLLVLAVLGKQACLPIPSTLFVLAAGALAHSGRLSLPIVVGISVITFLAADLAWYEAGRRSGDRLLRFVCGFSRDPEASVNRARAALASHGLRTLLASKFILGLDAVAAPLAGAAAAPRLRFVIFDAFGSTLWTVTFTGLGYIFSDQLDLIAAGVTRMGALVAFALIAGSGFFLVRRFARRRSFVPQFASDQITPGQLRDRLNVGEEILLVDMQREADDVAETKAIPGAVRIDPDRLEQYKDVFLWPRREIVLYCASPCDFTSARVTFSLRKKGVEDIRFLAGGLHGWIDCGFPVTSDVRIPPTSAVWVSSADGIPSHG
jgi:membrane protein DedA with SNARE-associated domain/rhodanese-related sulfurtransferase